MKKENILPVKKITSTQLQSTHSIGFFLGKQIVTECDNDAK